MATWLRTQEQSFDSGLLIQAASRSTRARSAYTVLLRSVRVVDNHKLFGPADVIVYVVVVDGYPDMKSGKPFWSQQLLFAGVDDGATLGGLDSEAGLAIYRGKPADFLNLYLLVVRDKQTTRDLSQVLSDNLAAEGVGTLAGAAVSTLAGLPPGITVPMARELVTKAVDTTLDYFAKQKNPVIGVYYASLLAQKDFGAGLHPKNYPPEHLDCGKALQIAYEVCK
jgi:hypothetical protein